MLKAFYKLLVRLAGENYQAYRKCNDNTRLRIRSTGILVLVIFTLSFLSCMEAFTEFFHSIWIGLTIGLFFGWVVTNMYLFLLYTLTRNVLVPENIKAHSRLSLALRVGTVAFLAIVVSKPIEHFLFKNQVKTQLVIYKTEAFDKLAQSINTSYSRRIAQAIESDKPALLKQRAYEINRMEKLVLNNEYYFKSIGFLNKKPLMWFISFLFIVLFCYPVILKRNIALNSIYYLDKEKTYKKIVDDNYTEFKSSYILTVQHWLNDINKLQPKNKEEAILYEAYLDPPYNFNKKTQVSSNKSEDLFLEKFYS